MRSLLSLDRSNLVLAIEIYAHGLNTIAKPEIAPTRHSVELYRIPSIESITPQNRCFPAR